MEIEHKFFVNTSKHGSSNTEMFCITGMKMKKYQGSNYAVLIVGSFPGGSHTLTATILVGKHGSFTGKEI